MLAVVFVRIDLKRRVYRSQYLSGLESRMARFLDLRKKNYKLISAQRHTVSEARTQPNKRFTTDWSTLSPNACPGESLICLNLSKSKK